MATSKSAKNVSVRRNRDYSAKFGWTPDLNAAVLKFYHEARETATRGYMELLKELWDSAYPMHTNINKRALRERAAFLVRKSLSDNPPPSATTNRDQPLIDEQRSIATPALLSREHLPVTEVGARSIGATDNYIHLNRVDTDLKDRFLKFLSMFRTTPLHERTYSTKTIKTVPSIEISALNQIISDYIEANTPTLWDLNCITYAGALALLEKMKCLKERKNLPRNQNQKKPWIIQREEKINSIRRKISHIQVTLQIEPNHRQTCTPRQRRIFSSIKKLCNGLSYERLNAKLGQLKHDLRAEVISLQDDITRASRSSINRTFAVNAKLIYRGWREQQHDIKSPPSASEIHSFWSGIWGNQPTLDLNKTWYEQLCSSYCEHVTPKHYQITKPLMQEILTKMHNNKSPGCDLISGYWLKNLTSLHNQLLSHLTSLKEGTLAMPDWLATSRTTLIPKNKDTHLTNNYRPIACQNTTYKLYTSILTHFIEDHCISNNILYPEQAGGRKGSWGCTDQLLINKMVLDEVRLHQRSAFLMWFDYKKAFDSVPHAWIHKAAELIKLPADILNAIYRLTNSWSTRASLNTPTEVIETQSIRYKTGVLQGDCLALMLFMLSINPLSHLLQRCEGYNAGLPGNRDTKITHLLFVDDLKTFDSSQEKGMEKLKIITEFTNSIGMKFGEDKCAYLNIEKGRRKQLNLSLTCNGLTLNELQDGDTYRYLGQDESICYNGPLNKDRIVKEYVSRVKKIWRSDLNSLNKVRAHNCFALPVLTPTYGILDWTKSEVEDLDIKTRKVLTMLGAFHRNSDIDRLYASRRDGGRGLCSVFDAYLTRLITLSHHITLAATQNVFLAKVCEHERDKLLRASNELRIAFAVPVVNSAGHRSDPSMLSKSIKNTILNNHLKAWREKPMHGYLNKKMSSLNTDYSLSNAWTRSHKLTSHVEGYLCAIQEQEVATRKLTMKRQGNLDVTSSLCRHCHNQAEDISHIIGSCPRLAGSMYLPLRHNEVAKTLYNAITQKAEPTLPFKNPESISHAGPLEIWWDRRINTSPKVANNKPDMVIWNNDTNECNIVEVGVPLDTNVQRIEDEKCCKYMPLKICLQRMYPDHKVEIAAIIIGATGHVTKNLAQSIMKLGFQEKETVSLISRLQERAILGTVKIAKSALRK